MSLPPRTESSSRKGNRAIATLVTAGLAFALVVATADLARKNGQANRESLFCSIALSAAQRKVRHGAEPAAAVKAAVNETLAAPSSARLVSPEEWQKLGGSYYVFKLSVEEYIGISFRAPRFLRRDMRIK